MRSSNFFIDCFICPLNVGIERIHASLYESYGGKLISINSLAQTYRKHAVLLAERRRAVDISMKPMLFRVGCTAKTTQMSIFPISSPMT